MTHTSVGFKGSVNQVAWAQRAARAEVPFKVAGPEDWKPAIVSGADRTIRVAVGTADACGVGDTTDAFEDIQFLANGSGSDRYDLLIAAWTWNTDGGAVGFEVIQGTAGAGVPDVGVLTRVPGALYHGLIAVVRVPSGVGTFTAANLVDCRVWGGTAGPLITPVDTHVALLDVPAGGVVRVAATGREFISDGSIVSGVRDLATGRVSFHTGSLPPDSALTGVITVAAFAVPYRVVVMAMGRTGFGAAPRAIAWDFDSIPASATLYDKDDPTTRVNVASAEWTALTATMTLEMPANVAATFRPMYRANGNGYSRGAVVWHRSRIS